MGREQSIAVEAVAADLGLDAANLSLDDACSESSPTIKDIIMHENNF
jgi:hypothetical protein